MSFNSLHSQEYKEWCQKNTDRIFQETETKIKGFLDRFYLHSFERVKHFQEIQLATDMALEELQDINYESFLKQTGSGQE